MLHQGYGVPLRNITVITPYRAQIWSMTEKFQTRNLHEIDIISINQSIGNKSVKFFISMYRY